MKTNSHRILAELLTLTVLLFSVVSSYAASGTEGASFLDIPVGARPAALGSAYSALATDGYAPTYNPGGLGFLKDNEVTGMHLAYLDSVDYEYASFVHPFSVSNAMGAAIQYLVPGTINGTDINGNSIGTVNGHYAAYSLSYAHTFQERWALGVTGKAISAAISDVSATAYAADIGAYYKANDRLSLALVAANMGTSLKFVSQSDNLPAALRLGAAYAPTTHWTGTAEMEYEGMGLFNVHMGVEWSPLDILSLRVGYKTDTLKDLSPLAGFTTGLGLQLWGQELDYAWLPLGDLGNTQYISLVFRFGNEGRVANVLKKTFKNNDDSEPDFNQMMKTDNDEKLPTQENQGYQLINPVQEKDSYGTSAKDVK